MPGNVNKTLPITQSNEEEEHDDLGDHHVCHDDRDNRNNRNNYHSDHDVGNVRIKVLEYFIQCLIII